MACASLTDLRFSSPPTNLAKLQHCRKSRSDNDCSSNEDGVHRPMDAVVFTLKAVGNCWGGGDWNLILISLESLASSVV